MKVSMTFDSLDFVLVRCTDGDYIEDKFLESY
jgi:hypothetical protein